MTRGKRSRALLGVAPALACAALLGTAATAPAAPGGKWSSYTRPATHEVVRDSNVAVPMRDGVVLRANVDRPAAAGRYPALVIQTPYNKDGGINSFLGGATQFFSSRGYVVVTVDVRGTGSSGGQWDSFGRAEQRDGAEVVEWAARQRWSSGRVGLYGPSYMGLTQLYTAALRPPHLKAIFPIVPLADGYRDIVYSGGQLNASFIPLWLGLVTAGSLTPTPASDDPAAAMLALADHVRGAFAFQLPAVLDSTLGNDIAFDGPFWAERSPIEVIDRIRVPAFVVGGHHDLFQRGEPLVYERLKRRVPARLLMGPWTHVGGSTGEGLPRDGVPSLQDIALRWFDRFLLGKRTRIGRIPRVTQYVYGKERYVTQRDWPDPRLRVRRLYLRGGGRLGNRPPRRAEAPQTFTQQPASGVCTQSTEQWTAGLGEGIPCTQDNSANEQLGDAVYTTAPLKRTLQLSGPVMARLWVRSTARDAVLAVRVTDVAPGGASRELSAGWLAASFRAVDRSRSRYVRGRLLQPWHPFTRGSAAPLEPGQPVSAAVEIFPLRAAIRRGHRLRITVGPSDFPHQVPPLPQLQDSLGGQVAILNDERHRSFVNLPVLGRCRGSCKPLPVPNLRRGG
jgi:putative CocE/NonD family hydrolase